MKLPPWIARIPPTRWGQGSTLLLDPYRGGAPYLAEVIAQAALCQTRANQPCGSCQSCHLWAQKLHPDYQVLENLKKDKTLDALLHFVRQTPTLAPVRIAFLPDFDRCNDHVANALLKTLEEPPPHARFILSAPNRRALKATVVSRCQVVTLPRPPFQEAQQWLVQTGMNAEVAARTLSFCGGNPWQAQQAETFPDPQTTLPELLALLQGRRHRFFECLPSDDETLLTLVLAELRVLALAAQCGQVPQGWVVPKVELSPQALVQLHRLYAHLSALAMPGQRALNLGLNLKALFFETLDQRTATL